MTTTIPAGWKLVPIEPTIDMIVDGQDTGSVLGPRVRRIYAAMLNAAPAAPGVSRVEDAPAAGDALDAARYRWLRDESLGVPDGMREIYVIQQRLPHTEGTDTELFDTALDAAVDAAIAAQRKGDA